MKKRPAFGETDPQIRFVNHIQFPPGYTMEKRVIYDHEWIYCLDGEAKMDYQNTTFTLRPGSLLHLEPFQDNKMYVESGHTFSAHCVHFDFFHLDPSWDFSAEWAYFLRPRTVPEQERLQRLAHRPNPVPDGPAIPPMVEGLDPAVMAPLFRELYRSFGRLSAADHLKMRSVFLLILSHVLTFLEDAESRPRFDPMADDAVYYMKEHYREPITALSLAEHFHLSAKYFGSLFKKSTGMTIQEKLLSIRMEHASQLLIYSKLPIQDIAAAVGIPDVFYFTKLFKKEKGMPPGRYRRQLQ